MKSVKHITYLSVLLLCYISFAEAQKRPLIGISDLYKDGNSSAVPRSYVDAVLQVGGLPVVIPLMYDNEKITELLSTLDGIIFTGGEDFDPSYYNERPIPQMGKVNAFRDEFDIKLLRLAVEQGVPVLGICRGLQLINITYGGSLYQDLSTQYHDNSIRHRQKQPKEDASHSVIVEDNTVFSSIVQQRMLMVNSSHHQAIKKVAPGFRVAGKSPDKIVEAIEKIDSKNWILGVQFHPEVRVTRDDAMRRIFQRFIDEASNSNNSGRERNPAYASQPRTNRDRYTEQLLPQSSQSRPQSDYELQSRSQSQLNSQTYQQPQIVYKSVTDTQYIYKVKVDTQYIYKSIDTVYLSIVDTIYDFLPTDTVYLSVVDTIFFPIDYASNPISEIKKPTSAAKKQNAEKQVAEKQAVEKQVAETPAVEKSKVQKTAPVKQTAENPKHDEAKSKVDTMIFTPGTLTTPVSDKEAQKTKKAAEENEKKKAKAAEKEAIKIAKAAEEEARKKAEVTAKEAKIAEDEAIAKRKAEMKAAKKEEEEKEKLYRQEQMELAKLKKKEQKDKEEQAKKDLKEKEEQAKKEQKEKEEQAKKEQKEKEEQAKKEQKEKEEQAKKELKEKEEQAKQAKKELKNKEEQAKKELKEKEEQAKKEQKEKKDA